jgi:hypothetical protein
MRSWVHGPVVHSKHLMGTGYLMRAARHLERHVTRRQPLCNMLSICTASVGHCTCAVAYLKAETSLGDLICLFASDGRLHSSVGALRAHLTTCSHNFAHLTLGTGTALTNRMHQ